MTIFVARQPIFDGKRNVFAYELLFRSGVENVFSHHDPDQATLTVIDHSLFGFGLDNLVGEKWAFINMTRKMLVEDFVSVLPPNRIFLEILETITPDNEVMKACRTLKEAGYKFALDDFVLSSPELEPFLSLADIVKVDFLGTTAQGRKILQDVFTAYPKLKLLAEKVENQDVFQEGVGLGYSYFQGYFFCKPQIVTGRKIPQYKLNYLRFIQAINREELDLKELEGIIRQEISLSVRLLHYLNSAALGLRSKVTSIRHALVLLGERPLRKWAHLTTVAGLGDDKPEELVLTCLIRARFCELLAQISNFRDRENDLFLVGLLSAIDAIMDRPKPDILKEMAVAEEIRAVLLGQETSLSSVYLLVLAYEKGDWETANTLLQTKLRIQDQVLPDLYAQSIEWAKEATSSIQT